MKNIITNIIIFCILWIVGYFVYFSLQPPETMISNNKKVTSDLTLQVEELQISLNNYSIQVEELTHAKDDLQQQLNNLINEELENNAETIEELQSQIESLGTSIETLNSQKAELQATITELNTTISNLTEENANKDETISSLNSQITNLNNQIMNYQTQIETLNSQIEELEAQIEDLENNTSGELTDLTGTTWIFNETITAEAGYGQFQINTLWGEELGSISNSGAGSLCVGYDLDEDTMMPISKANCFLDSSALVTSYGSNKVLYITGGNDVTNTDLITWLQKNATQSNIIVFTINGEIYQAESGMTWEEWIDSSYNVDNKFGNINGYPAYTNGSEFSGFPIDPYNVAISDIIEVGRNYTYNTSAAPDII